MTAGPAPPPSAAPRVEMGGDGKLRFIPADGSPPAADVRIHLAWPLRWRDRYIVILDPEGREVCLPLSIDDLDPACRSLVRGEIEERYFMTRIRSVISVRAEHVVSYWDVDTDRGRREFVIEESERNPRRVAEAGWLFEDAGGNRFLIDDVRKLNTRSRRLLGRLIE